MKSRARLVLTFEDVETARAVASSVRPDDEGYVRTSRRGRTVTAETKADSEMSLLHTLDDYLACVTVAESTAGAARPRGHAPRRRG